VYGDVSAEQIGLVGEHLHTTNGPIKFVFDVFPVDSVLNFDAQPTNSPVHAVLHPAYEETFTMQTTNVNTVLDYSRNVEDPLGTVESEGHPRSASRHDMYGELKWVSPNNDSQAGWVNITTTNTLISLII
jgi:hypothetical protein